MDDGAHVEAMLGGRAELEVGGVTGAALPQRWDAATSLVRSNAAATAPPVDRTPTAAPPLSGQTRHSDQVVLSRERDEGQGVPAATNKGRVEAGA